MPFNGDGVFSAPSLPGSWNPAISGQDATPDDWNTLLADLELALSTCWTTDGQSTITADQPMAGFKFTDVGNAVLRNQYASMGQVQDGGGVYAAAGGTADVITIALSPVIAAYAVGQRFRIKMGAGANTTAVTLNVNAVGAGPVVWPDGTALVPGDIPAGGMFDVEVKDISTPTAPIFHLQTVGTPPLATARSVAGKVYVQTFTATGTYTPHAGMVNCIIECLGGGGGGGGAATAAANTGTAGAGGGAGSLSRKLATAADIGTSKAVTIGAAGAAGTSGNNAGGNGGDTSVGALCIGKGGTGGAGSPGSGVVVGGLGGVAGTGDVTGTGMPGCATVSTTGTATDGGEGGSSSLGGGGRPALATSVGAGSAGTGYGAGGSGGGSFSGGGAAAGGPGTAGIVIITEFCNQ